MPRQFQPPAPFIAPASGDLDLRLAQVAQAINKKADATTQPVFSGVGFIAPNGTVYMLTVDNAGNFRSEVVTP